MTHQHIIGHSVPRKFGLTIKSTYHKNVKKTLHNQGYTANIKLK